MKILSCVALLMLLSISVSFGAQAKREGPTKIDVPNGADVDGLEIDQNDTGQFAIKISSGFFLPVQYPISYINTLTPPTTGAQVGCTNCIRTSVCEGSGTTVAAWVVPIPTGTYANGRQDFPDCQ